MYNFGAGNYPGLCSHIHNKLLKIESVEGIEEIWTTIKKQSILGGSQIFIPKRKSKGSTLPVWCNGEIKLQINCLRTLRRKTSAKFSLTRLLHLQQAEDKLQQEIIKARVNYESKLANDLASNNSYTIYRYSY